MNRILNKLFSLSIRSQLFLIVFIPAFFAAGIIVYSGTSLRNEKIRGALKDSAMLADIVANEHLKMVADARQLMLTLAQLSEIKGRNAAGMRLLLKEVLSANPKYSNIFIADRSGKVLASAVPSNVVNISDRRYFTNALAGGRFSSGEYMISRFTGKSVLAFGYPFKDSRGKILGVIVMGIDLTHYRTLLDTLQLPSNSGYLLLDHQGIIMTRGLNPADFMGAKYNSAAFRRMADGPDKDTFVAIAHDGKERFISYRKIRLEGESTPYMYIRAGIPVNAALSGANADLLRNLALLSASLCFVVVFVWLIGKHSILDRIVLLERASRSLADGDLHVKVSGLVSGGEFGRLGMTFDHMARQIALRNEALEQKTLEQNAILENALVGIALLKDRQFAWINGKMKEMFGYSMSEISGLPTELFYPSRESYEQVGREAYPMLEAGRTYYSERLMKRKDGSLFWCSISGKAVDQSVMSKGAIWVLEDINERKLMEASLRQSEERFRALFESAIDALFIIDTDGNFVDVNKIAYERLGYTKAEILGMSISQLDHPDFAAKIPQRMEQLREQGRCVCESAHLRKDGTAMPVEINARLMEFEGRKVIFSVIRDISERKLMEESLRESEKKYHTLFEQSPDGILLIDAAGRIIEFNETAHSELGYTREEFAKLSLSDIDPVESPEEIRARIGKLLDGKKVEFDVKHISKQREVRDVHIITQPIELSGLTVFYAIWQDITEQKRTDERARQSLREKETLLRELYHRTKNNMQIITSFMNLQAMEIDDEKTKRILEDTKNRIRSMALVHEKLYKAKNLSQVSLSDYIEDLAQALLKSHNAVEKHISLHTDVEDIPVSIDTITPLGLVINELMTNALKHAFPGNRKGDITIKAALLEDESLELTFSDNGIGIPKNINLNTTESLGLTIVRMLVVSQLKGNLEIENRNGATFIVTIKDNTIPAKF